MLPADLLTPTAKVGQLEHDPRWQFRRFPCAAVLKRSLSGLQPFYRLLQTRYFGRFVHGTVFDARLQRLNRMPEVGLQAGGDRRGIAKCLVACGFLLADD